MMATATAAAATIQHPKLGAVRGKAAEDGSGITQFLGIKYASLKDRFAPPELVEGDPEGTVEAREFGPHVICLPNALDMELSYIQQKLPSPPPPPPPTSDVDGLNLNITVPPAGTPKPTPAGFPVLVFIHGGGLFIGANWWPQYDFKRLVKLGVEMGLPFVGVNVGYRLGIPGFLTSAELHQHSYLANNGLRDQAAALRWVRAHIGDFGGDPANVTAMGESAGGTSALLHLHSPAPLFARVISMSGTPLLMRPVAPAAAERTYAAAVANLDTSSDPDSRVAALRDMPAASLLAIAAPPVMFVRDGDVVMSSGTHEGLAASMGPPGRGRMWCGELLAGYADGADASILAAMVPALREGGKGAARALREVLWGVLEPRAPGVAGRVCEVYGICDEEGEGEGEGEGNERQVRAIVALATDLLFRAGARAYVREWSAAAGAAASSSEAGVTEDDSSGTSAAGNHRSWLYRFTLPNPWPGRWHGVPSHIMDVALLFQNFDEALPSPAYRDAAKKWAESVLRFVAGKGPGWEAGGEVGVFGNEGLEAVAWREEVRGDRLARVLREEGVGVDVVVEAWEAFMRGGA